MSTPARGWTVAYFASWAVALAPAGSIASLFLDADDTTWLLGALSGVVLGLGVAMATRTRSGLHRALRLAAPALVGVGVVLAVLMFYQSGVERRTGQFLGGLEEFVFAFLGLAIALTGGGLWFAGVSGPRAPPR